MYFVPPIFISQVPEVVVLDYDAYNKRSENKGKHKGGLKGQIAERIMFLKLQQYFEKTGDDVIVVHSHKFLDNSGTINEKDFVVVNLTNQSLLRSRLVI